MDATGIDFAVLNWILETFNRYFRLISTAKRVFGYLTIIEMSLL